MQLVVNLREPLTLTLWDVAADKLVREFKVPSLGPNASSSWGNPLLALAGSGAFAGACVSLPNESSHAA